MQKVTLHYIINIWKYVLVVPHLILYNLCSSEIKMLVDEDVIAMNSKWHLRASLAYYLIYTPPYRNLYYHRMGHFSKVLKILLPEYRSFFIGRSIKHFGGGAFVLSHPYGTIINAKSIGRNFSVCQLTTVGNKFQGRNDLVPTIGDNVTLGANVCIIGDVKIGNNVTIGAGSVVVRDIPDNSVAAGNPARIVRINE